MGQSSIDVELKGPVAWVWLARPEVHNAFDMGVIEELTSAFQTLGDDAGVRVVVLAGRGRSFSAGAQVQWMKEQGAASPAENIADAKRLANMLHVLSELPKPTIARVQGAAIGGGVGLVCACSIAIASESAVFATSEVRLGLLPYTISSYVVRAIGGRNALKLFTTGERIPASLAKEIGMVHEVVPDEQLDVAVCTTLDALLAGAPGAQRDAKQLIKAVEGRPITEELMEETAKGIAHRRAGAEAAEGLGAFMEKRPAKWVPEK